MNDLHNYVTAPPSPQTALDIFQGDWVSALPDGFARWTAGNVPLFDDARIHWLVEQLGSVAGKSVLELGPLEAGHAHMLEKLGAARIVSVEANRLAYLKCLVMKEILEMKRTRFLCGDFVGYLHETEDRFDLCVASGVLYHMRNPAELLALIARAADRVMLWTHYYDEEAVRKRPELASRFGAPFEYSFGGFKHRLHPYSDGAVPLPDTFFRDGDTQYSYWMERDAILQFLNRIGFTTQHLGFESQDHPNGPSFAVLAER